MKKIARSLLKPFGIGITSLENLRRLEDRYWSDRAAEDDIAFLTKLPDESIAPAVRNLHKSHAQLRQDLFVLSELRFKRNGFFVEFGATDGKDLSNTYLLEKEFAWDGIVAEPAVCWHGMLRQNRTCRIDTRCVWKKSDETVTFNEVAAPGLSTIDQFSDGDGFKEARRRGNKYAVTTVSLCDLLDSHGAPRDIDYLSIDTEGSELEILKSFDFEKYKFRVITCEHNFTSSRDDVFQLLIAAGYQRKFDDISRWEDWYVRA